MTLKKFYFKLTHWESWHYHLKYIPIAPVWLWYCIKAGSWWFFTPSNPTITFGGFEGEGKMEIYKQLPPESFPKSILIKPGISFSELDVLILKNDFRFPFVAKPDEGMMGYMFRRISNDDELRQYHEQMVMPYVIQSWIDFPLEVSIFYCRMPDSQKGIVTGFLMKEMPVVIGNGTSTLYELISDNKDLMCQKEAIMLHHQGRINVIIPEGEKFILSYASNRGQGGKLISLSTEIDEKLVNFMDQLNLHSKQLFYGRYDIKCASIARLKDGLDYSILEYNGAGAGIQHIYGNGLTLWKACATILKHWKILFKISVYNHKVHGVPYWDYKSGKIFLKSARKNLADLKKMDEEFPSF